MVSAKLMIALACLNACAVHGSGEAAADALEGNSGAQDEPVVALAAEKVEFLGYVNDSDSNISTRDMDCRQWPTQNQMVTVGEIWWEDNSWYAQTLKMWNHRHLIDLGICVETRFGGDKDSGQNFYAVGGIDDGDKSIWSLQAYKIWSAQLTQGVIGWRADKARWFPCTNVPGCGGGSHFAMNKKECFRARLKSGRVIQACKTYTNQDYRLCGEYSRKHHGINRCGTGRDSHYWFGTEEGCQYN